MKSLIFLSAILATSALAAEDRACTIHAKGSFYDLTPLKSNKDHQVAGSESKDIFAINICQGVRTETYGVKDSIDANEIAAFQRRGRGDFVIGKVNSTVDFYDNHPRLVLSGGSKCKSSDGEPQDIRASTVVDFICDASVSGQGQPRLVAQLPPGKLDEGCGYLIEWRTQYACPANEGGFIWNTFVFLAVIFLSLLLAYTVLGTLYNRFVLQLRGVDQIPQFSFESMKYHANEAWDWAKDIFSAYSSHPAGSSRNGGLYGANPVSHQAGVGINVRGGDGGSGDLESGSGGFVRPQLHGKIPLSGKGAPLGAAASSPSPFGRAPPRPADTNPVSHQTQVNAELAHQNAVSQQQEQEQRQQHSSTSPARSSDSRSSITLNPLITVSQSPSPSSSPIPQSQSQGGGGGGGGRPAALATASLFAAGAVGGAAAGAAAASIAPPPSASSTTAQKDFLLGDDDDEEDDDEEDDDDESEQDYNEYNMANEPGAPRKLGDVGSKPGSS